MTPQVVPNIPTPQTPKFESPSKAFANEVGKVMSLANTGKLNLTPNSQGASLKDMLASKDISDYDKEKLKQDYLSQSLQPLLSKDIRSGNDIAYKDIEPYANSKDFKKLGFEPFANNEERYIQNRSFWNSSSKIFNKFLTSTGVGAASSLTPIFGQSLSDRLTQWQKEMDEYNKIFYTEKEQESNYNPFTTKFYDNLLPSLGFTVGNIGASLLLTRGVGGVLSKGFSMLGKTEAGAGILNVVSNGKLSAYKKIKGIDKADDIIGSITAQAEAVQGATNAAKGLGKFADLSYRTGKFLSKRLPYSIYSGNAESHIEASMARAETLESLRQEFEKQNKRPPNAEELLQMARLADDVYDKTLSNGTILLSATNLFEVDALMGKFGIAGKLINIPKSKFLGGAFHFDDIVYRGGAIKGWEKKKMKELILPILTSTVLDGIAEGFEEGSQYMIANGIQSWAMQKFKNKDFESVKEGFLTEIFKDIKDPASFIFSSANMDDEFTQNAFFGALSGMLMTGGSKGIINPLKNKITNAPDVAQKRIDLLNKANDFISMKFVGAHEDKLNYFNQNAEILKQSIENNDLFAIENVTHNDLYTWVATSIAAGGFDLRMEQLEDLKNLQGEEFENFFSLKYNEENKQLAKKYLDSIEKKGRDIASDIEKFREIENIYEWTDKEEKDLTEEEKQENENYELFEAVKYDLSYYYSKIKNFDKRTNKMLSELENSLGSTNLFSTVKKIAFSDNVIADYKKTLEDSIIALKKELQGLESPNGLFLQEYKEKITLINKKQQVLNQINAVKEDFDKYLEDNSDKLTEEQKKNVTRMSARQRDLMAIQMILDHEVDALNFDFKITLGEKDILDKKTLLKDLLPIASDLFTVTQNKQIVLNKFDKINTRKGKHEFIQNLKKAKKEFEKGKSLSETDEESFLSELRHEYKDKGYPENTEVLGLELTYFTDSKESIEENEYSLSALERYKEEANNLITLVTEEKDGKNISYFITEFNTLNEKIQIKGETKEKVEKKIDELFDKVKTTKLQKETTGKFIIQRIKKPLEKNKDGKLYTPIAYTITSEYGDSIFKNKELTKKEVLDFLKGIKNVSNLGIRKYEILPLDEFKKLTIKVNQLKSSNKKIEMLAERMFVVNEQLKKVAESLESDIFKDLQNSPINDVLNSQYITLYSIQGQIKKIENSRKELLEKQKQFSINYKNSKGTNRGWQNTVINKAFVTQLKEIENDLTLLMSNVESINTIISSETSQSEEMAKYYSTFRQLLESYNNLIDERDLLQKFKKELINNYQELVDEKTTKVINFKQQTIDKEQELFKGLTDKNKEDIIKKLDDIIQKEREIMTIQRLFIEQRKTLERQKDAIEAQIKNIQETIILHTDEGYSDYNDLEPLYNQIDKLTTDLAGIQAIIESIDKNIDFNNNSMKDYGSEFEKSMLDDYRQLKLMTDVVANVSKALSFRDQKLMNDALYNRGEKELFNSYSAQRKVTFFGGEEQDMEFESVPYDYSGGRYKSNAFMQGTGRDITTEQDEEKNHIIPTQEEINSNPSIEFYRFLASNASEDIVNDFNVMLVTPRFLENHLDRQLYKDLLDHIKSQFDHIKSQFDKQSDIDFENDLFQIIVEKGTNKPVRINNQFLSCSFYKASTKFETHSDGSLKHITEKAVLQLFKTSEEYSKAIEGKSDEEISEYLKDVDTLKSAIKYAKEEYGKELQILRNKINSLENKVIVSNIEDVTNGIFVRGKRQSVPAVLNKSNTSIGIVVKEGEIKYRNENGIQIIPTNLGIGTIVAIDKTTQKWIPVETRNNNQKEVEEILGVLDFTIFTANEKNKTIHEICNKTEIDFGENEFQVFKQGSENKKVREIPLYPRFGTKLTTGDNQQDNWFRRWSVMTTYFNFGHDKKNPKNTFYFTHRDDLAFYNGQIGKIEYVSKEKLQKLLESWFSQTMELLSESEQATLDAIVQHIKNKKRNISAQYTLFSDNKFLLPQYNHKTKSFSFKMYDSYIDYVLGDKSLDSGIVSTTVQKADDRFNFQQSLILSNDMKVSTTEFDTPVDSSNGIKQKDEEEKPEVKSIPSMSTEKPVLKLDISKTNPETDVDIDKIAISIVNGGIFANYENTYSFDGDSGAKFVIYREELTGKNTLKLFDEIIELRKEILSIRPQNNEEKLNLDFKASKLRREYSNLLYFSILFKNKNNEIQLTNDELFNEQTSQIGELKTIETYYNEVLTFKEVKNSPFGALYYFLNNKNEEVYLVGDRLKSALDNGTIKKVEIISDTQSGIKPDTGISELVQSDIKRRKQEEIDNAIIKNAEEIGGTSLENKPAANIQEVTPAVDERGRYLSNSIFRYFADIFYGKRGGFHDLSDREFNGLTEETKAYLIRIYHQLKSISDGYAVWNAEEVYKKDMKEGKSPYNIEKIKQFNGKDSFFNFRRIVDNDQQRINYAVMFLSNDPSGRDNGITNGIARATRVKKFEYPSKEVLKNLDEIFNGESVKYDAELDALEQKETPSEFSTEKETSLAMMNELELFNYLKEKEEPEINKYESYNDLLNNQTREIQNNIKRAKGIKNYLLKLAERDSSDSLNDLTIEKILKNNPNIKKSC